MSKLDDIMFSIEADYYQAGEGRYPSTVGLIRKRAKQQLLAEVLDMIGEDEKLRPNHSKMSQITHQIETRNFLKMQYRKAAKERLK